MSRSQLWPVVTVPLFPYIKPNQQEPVRPKRLRPEDSLNLKLLVSELEACRITTLDLDKNPWSLISVFSPYSSEIHVMLMETSTDRYLPSPEWLPDQEGEKIVGLWLQIAAYLRKQPQTNRISIGYNWSPRSWGPEEEKTGFQSIPTKWHPMLWNWPQFPRAGQNSDAVSWMATEQLSPALRRILGTDNAQAVLLEAIMEKLAPVLDASACEIYALKAIAKEQATVSIMVAKELEDLLASCCFFSRLIKPMAQKLNELMVALSESFTDMDCGQIDALIECTVKARPDKKALDILRKPPRLKQRDEVRACLKAQGLPVTLADSLYEPIRARCLLDGQSGNWWRKGFGYALVIGDSVQAEHCSTIKIMPGVYVGQGGVVEAQGVILQRPEDRSIPVARMRDKSMQLQTLKQFLEGE